MSCPWMEAYVVLLVCAVTVDDVLTGLAQTTAGKADRPALKADDLATRSSEAAKARL